jgi:hypothetical protein
MRTQVPEKLIKIADQIKEGGSVALTKLTVLKKWFERPLAFPLLPSLSLNRPVAEKARRPAMQPFFFLNHVNSWRS